MDPTLLRQHCDSLLLGMRVDRYSWWLHWRELSDYILPRRYKWLVTPNQMNRGSPINQRIIDSTGSLAWRTLASGMMAGITSPGRPWARLTLPDKDLAERPNVRVWLDEVCKRIMRVFAESNFYNSIHTVYGDLGCFGTGPMLMYEDFEDVIRCYNPCAGEYYLSNSARLQVTTFAREYTRTMAQLAEEFGEENCSQDVKSALATKGVALTRETIVGHLIEPNRYFNGGNGLNGMAYREVYWEVGKTQTQTLRIRGFNELPFIAPRWDIVSNDAYGRSPGMDALGDIKQLQVEQKRKSQGIDKMVNPPMVADVALKNEPATLIPGGITYVPSTGAAVGFKPVYEVSPQLEHMIEDIREVQSRVKTCFYSDLFMMISQLDTVRSAAEIAARKEEKLIQLGPVLERFEGEGLDPAISRTYNIMKRKGLLPPPPPEMHGQFIQVEYISMLAEAQRSVMTAGVERLASFVGNIAAGQQGRGGAPEILDNIDWDEMVDEYADMLGVSPKIIIPYAKVLQVRAQRAQQQQNAALAQNGMAAVQGAKVLSETDVGGGMNALQKMTGQI